jgi:hypothetical protein
MNWMLELRALDRYMHASLLLVAKQQNEYYCSISKFSDSRVSGNAVFALNSYVRNHAENKRKKLRVAERNGNCLTKR